MPATLQQRNSRHIDTIISKGRGGKNKSPLFEQFIREFYKHTPVDFLTNQKPECLYEAARSVWEFVFERKNSSERRVRVYNPTLEEHGWETERTVVELNTTDSPFILDSVTAELTQHGHRIYEVVHPILPLKRDKNGRIYQILEDREDTENLSVESVMHFQITHISDKEELRKLAHNIETALYFVHLAVSDWRPTRGKTAEIVTYLTSTDLPYPAEHVEEVRDFIQWCLDNNFIFLGFREYDFTHEKNTDGLKVVEGTNLGIFRADFGKKAPHEAMPQGLMGLPNRSIEELKNSDLVEITKSTRRSIVHRPVHMDYIGIKKCDKKGNIIGEYRLLGLFTSAVYFQSARLIPIIRRKIDDVMERSGFDADSHNAKALMTVLESYPRDELLQISRDDLFTISMGIFELTERPHTRLFVRKDPFMRFVSCIVFIPRELYNTQMRQRVQGVLESAFDGTVTDYYTQVTESPLARVHMLIEVMPDAESDLDIAEVEARLVEVTSNWHNGLRDKLVKDKGERHGERLYARYVNAFPETYKDLYHFGGTFRDIIKMEEAIADGAMTVDLYQLEKDDSTQFQLKLYRPGALVTLSEILPLLENMGFHCVDELTFRIQPQERPKGQKESNKKAEAGPEVWVLHFRLEVSRVNLFERQKKEGELQADLLAQIKGEFETALLHIWRKNMEDDALNKLILRAGLGWRDIVLMRAYTKYIVQTSFMYDYKFIASSIARHPAITRLLVSLFHTRFGGKLSMQKRVEETEIIGKKIQGKLSRVEDIADDRVIRQFLETIQATLRTNYFQKGVLEATRPYFSFKLNSKRVPYLPKPHPHAEIFVYSYDMEGVHLRGGKVARGGLRWSDRALDFRTEVLGLVKAQMVKNAVIVPVGSKGGFVVKRPDRSSREALMDQGKACYKTYLSGLLDITDNIVEGKIVPPKGVVRHDEEDPYLVVAADKGTATFSDLANSVAESYGFWLGDAFASGGSVGYDHKKMGITARGAWVSVQRHFREMGVDVQNDPVTVVGIGDMSGDVFGNGLLLSKSLKLVAAFNHLHIFIDPDPDPAVSFTERKRLFEMPRSSWEDYNKDLISSGGGVYERSAKSIPLSKAMQKLLDTEAKTLPPEEVLKHLLKAKVDLIWNGGIGTYVKAERESHESVGDKANDLLRVNGGEVRAHVIGEGGNLGLTQLGRIEYAMYGGPDGKGGRLNTDAIDNSAGVDCSDHEVNIKIALRKAVQNKKLSLKKRNELLATMTDEVAELVLRDNHQQTLAITIAEQEGYRVMDKKRRLMRVLEEKGVLDRALEFLPEDREIANRLSTHRGFTRPEISVLLAYGKLDTYADLVASNMPDDPYFVNDLLNYFPEPMRKRFRAEIEGHELRREIIATSVCNSIVNRMGSTFFHRMKEDTGLPGCDVARAYTVTRDAYNLRDIWAEIESLEGKISVQMVTELFLETRRLVERSCGWLLRNFGSPLNVSALVDAFKDNIGELEGYLEKIISPVIREVRDARLAYYMENAVPRKLATRIANLEAMSSALDIAHVAKNGPLPLRVVGEVYYSLGKRLRLGWLRHSARQLMQHTHWESLAIQTLTETFFDQQMRLAADVINTRCTENTCYGALDAWCKANEKELSRYDRFIEDLKRQEAVEHSMLMVAMQRVEALIGG